MADPVEVRHALIEWFRARDKRRYGLWITHNTAKGAANDLLSALDAAGLVLVPQSALDWLDGSAPDADGKWFGDDVPKGKPFWWRSKFRAMLSAAQVKP